MKRREKGFYRMLWNEYARSIPFSWHRTEKGAETIPKAYRYRGSVASDYYHHMCEGAAGLAAYAKESGMRIDWQAEKLVYADRINYHLCPPDMDERAMAQVLAEMDGKLAKTKIKDKRWRCPICGEPFPLVGK